MIDQNFIINTDRLRKSKDLKHKVDCIVPSGFLESEEEDISFGDTVSIKGEIYIVDDQLILHFNVGAVAMSACNICTGEAKTPIEINDFYHLEDLTQIKGPYFDFSTVLRDEIFLEVPQFTECNGGTCPDRELIKPYLSER